MQLMIPEFFLDSKLERTCPEGFPINPNGKISESVKARILYLDVPGS